MRIWSSWSFRHRWPFPMLLFRADLCQVIRSTGSLLFTFLLCSGFALNRSCQVLCGTVTNISPFLFIGISCNWCTSRVKVAEI
uniref:Uncharacterized protein n=1 Tax=Rhizophora mucronata TaxID=61149 RepID=A0A2P2NLU4_RHIMU